MLYVLLVAAVGWLIYKAYEFERFSRLEQVIVPIYALMMFFHTMEWTLQNAVQSFIMVLLAFFISDYQLKDVVLKFDRDRRGQERLFIKKNRSYVVGWLAVLMLGVLFDISFSNAVNSHHLLTELWQHIKKEVLLFATFTTESPWYIWLLSGLTTSFYTYRLAKRHKDVLSRKARARVEIGL